MKQQTTNDNAISQLQQFIADQTVIIKELQQQNQLLQQNMSKLIANIDSLHQQKQKGQVLFPMDTHETQSEEMSEQTASKRDRDDPLIDLTTTLTQNIAELQRTPAKDHTKRSRLLKQLQIDMHNIDYHHTTQSPKIHSNTRNLTRAVKQEQLDQTLHRKGEKVTYTITDEGTVNAMGALPSKP